MIYVNFLKVEASGNDFVLIDNFKNQYKFQYKDFARAVCNRHRGIGADGILVLEPSDQADFKMRYLNSDGSEGGMCGNGGRAIARYASHILGKNILSFEALNHIYKAEVKGDNVLLLMKNPENIKQVTISYKEQEIPIWSIDTGAPHAVIFWKDISSFEKEFDDFNILELGRYIRYHELFAPKGTNVNFVQKTDTNKIKIRTYEKGVENETLSCGTGSIASAIISFLKLKLSPPIKIIPLSKDELLIDFAIDDNKVVNVTIEGKVNFVFKGGLIYNEFESKISLNV